MKRLHYILFIIKIDTVEPYFIKNQNKPICANCRFFIPNKNECSKFGNVNIITGKYNYDSASNVRKDEDKCGEYAIFFQKNHFKFITVPYYFVLDNPALVFVISVYGTLYGILIYLFFNLH
jgi:hypothetical protein